MSDARRTARTSARPAAAPQAAVRTPRGGWRGYSGPAGVIEAHTPDEVPDALRAVQGAARAGYHAVGAVAYGAASAFDSALVALHPPDQPYLRFQLYRHAGTLRPPQRLAVPPVTPWEPDQGAGAHAGAVRRIRAHLRQGDCYQVNYTLRLRRPWSEASEDPYGAFHALVRAQGARHAVYLDGGHWVLGSASPELFFSHHGGLLRCQPMKGTAPRGAGSDADRALARALWHSAKERAENLMIVDLLRNDLGRIARPGTVRVPRLFALERYPTLWQMTSQVEARSRAPLAEVFAALFPCGSVTGAPKAAAMRTIAALEHSPRGFYTGAIGYLEPGGTVHFNVAIRTLAYDRASATVEYGTGSGVVWDSDPAGEYAECLAKARALHGVAPAPALFETLRWTPQRGYALALRHQRRLLDSAAYFGHRLRRGRVREALARAELTFPPTPQRVRVQFGPRAGLRVGHQPLPTRSKRPWNLALALEAVDGTDPHLHHKTVERGWYVAARAACPQADDVLLWNQHGEVTETTVANITLRLRGRWVTPPLRCGLLPGTLRADLLARGRLVEQVVRVAELEQCTALRLINSVRGVWPARLLRSTLPGRPSP